MTYFYQYIICINYDNLDNEWKNRLRFVRIYFETPTFDIMMKTHDGDFVTFLACGIT